jgi:hypothetical protein
MRRLGVKRILAQDLRFDWTLFSGGWGILGEEIKKRGQSRNLGK